MPNLEINDFSGGLTELDIPGAVNRFTIFDNVIIDQDKTILQRPGFNIYSSTAYQVGTAERVSKLINFDNDSELLALHNKKLEYISSGAWTSLLGPTSNNPFNTNTADSNVSDTQWNHQLFLASDSMDPPIKVYRDGGNTLRLRTAGLPKFTSDLTPSDGGLADAITLSNDLLSKMQTHMASNSASFALTGGTTNTSTSITMASTTGVAVGMLVSGSGIPEGATVVSFVANTSMAISIACTATASVSITFKYNGSNSSATGHHVAGGDLTTSATNLGALSNATTLATLITNMVVMRTEYTRHIKDAQAEINLPGVTGQSSLRANHVSPWGGSSGSGVYFVNAAATGPSILLSGGTTSGSATITMASTAGLVVGMVIAGSGIETHSTISSIVANTSITISTLATATATVTLTFTSASQTNYRWRHFLNLSLIDDTYTIPSTALIAEVLVYLNDLRDKWNWHTYAPLTHYNSFRYGTVENYTGLGAHKTSINKVEPYTWAKITPNYGSFIQYVKDILTEYEAHLGSDAHSEADTINLIPSSFPRSPANFHEAITLFNAISFFSYLHLGDALLLNARDDTTGVSASVQAGYGAEYYQLSGDTTSGLAGSITNITVNPRTSTYIGWKLCNFWSLTASAPFTWTLDTLGTSFPSGKGAYTVTNITGSGPYAVELSQNYNIGTNSGVKFLLTSSKYHFGADSSSSAFDFKAHYQDLLGLDYTFATAASLQLLSDYAKNLIDAIKVHQLSRKVVPTDVLLYQQFQTIQISGKKLNAYYYKADVGEAITTSGIVAYDLLTHYGNDYVRSGGASGVGVYNGLAVRNGQTYWPQSTATSFFDQDYFQAYNASTAPNGTQPESSSINYKGLFRYDYGVYTTAVQKTLTGTTTSASTTITMTSTSGLLTTMGIVGSGIPTGAYITAISPNISITISAAATASASVSLSFYGTKFQDFGAPSDAINIISFDNPVNVDGSEQGKSTSPATLTNIYTYANASNENWATNDTVNFRKEIYRTIGDGSVYYKVTVDGVPGDMQNSTTTWTDVSTDTYLVNQVQLYTNGGTVANDKPPSAKLVCVLDSRAYWAIGNKVYQSLAGDPDSVPENFFDELPEDVTGLSSTKSNIVAITDTNVYRLDGAFDELGNGFIRHERIFDKNGGFAPVKTDLGVFFVARDGIYFTDAFQCFRVTDLEDTFGAYTNTAAIRARVQGTYDNFKKKVYWTIQSNTGYSAPDLIYCLDLQFGVSRDVERPMPITSFSGGSSSFTKMQAYTGFRPTAVTTLNKALYYGDINGYVFKADPTLYYDLRVDTGTSATSWEKRTILWDIKTCNLNFGTSLNKKYFQRVAPQFKQEGTNLSAQISSDADKGKVVGDLPIIRSRKLVDWGDINIAPSAWTNPAFTAKAGNVIDEFRRFNGDGSLRSNFRAIELKNAYCVIVGSDQYGLINIANVSANIWSLTLVEAATRKWPLYSVDYYVRITGVDYPVTVRTSDSVVRVNDTGLTALSIQSGVGWEMWGYPKNERMHLIGFNIMFEGSGTNVKAYGGAASLDGGENA